MPIVTQCPHCGKRLKAPDERVGQQAKCPQCKNGFTIVAVGDSTPAAPKEVAVASAPASAPQAQPTPPSIPKPTPQSSPQPAAPPALAPAAVADHSMWHVQTADGSHYGPVTKADLDAWMADDRLDAECQVLMDGWDQWKWAEEVYPQLAASGAQPHAGGAAASPGGAPVAADHNPYSSPAAVGSPPQSTGSVDSLRVVQALQQTRPWVLMFGVLAFIAAASNVLTLLGSFVMLYFLPQAGIAMVLMFGAYTTITVYYGLLLLRYANGCAAVANSRGMADLETALEAQRNFWKFAGIMTLVAIGISLLSTLAMYTFLGVIMNALKPAGGG